MGYKVYLVGGAIRDRLLQLPVAERDWVVVGATADDLLAQGYRQVGKDFPVFLHPKTKEEYALARTERKTGPGYKGFSFDTSTSVTLEQDLLRRDLTINAIAEDEAGQLIDPYHGQKDLAQKQLRHISPAFSEDPVRILRVARFAARFFSLGFSIAPETKQLMHDMVVQGEVNALVAERVWQECDKALTTDNPEEFFNVLQACGALTVLFPELVDDLAQALAYLSDTAKKTNDKKMRFTALLLALSESAIESLSQRLKVPSLYKQLALISQTVWQQLATSESADQAMLLLKHLDAFRRPEQLEHVILLARALEHGIKACDFIERAYEVASSVSAKSFVTSGLSGKELGLAIEQKRLELIKNIA